MNPNDEKVLKSETGKTNVSGQKDQERLLSLARQHGLTMTGDVDGRGHGGTRTYSYPESMTMDQAQSSLDRLYADREAFNYMKANSGTETPYTTRFTLKGQEVRPGLGFVPFQRQEEQWSFIPGLKKGQVFLSPEEHLRLKQLNNERQISGVNMSEEEYGRHMSDNKSEVDRIMSEVSKKQGQRWIENLQAGDQSAGGSGYPYRAYDQNSKALNEINMFPSYGPSSARSNLPDAERWFTGLPDEEVKKLLSKVKWSVEAPGGSGENALDREGMIRNAKYVRSPEYKTHAAQMGIDNQQAMYEQQFADRLNKSGAQAESFGDVFNSIRQTVPPENMARFQAAAERVNQHVANYLKDIHGNPSISRSQSK